MKSYSAFVKDKSTGKHIKLRGDYNTKAEFIHDLRRNGYSVNPMKVKPSEIFNYIVTHTNMQEWDWKIKSLPTQ